MCKATLTLKQVPCFTIMTVWFTLRKVFMGSCKVGDWSAPNPVPYIVIEN